MSRYVVRVVQRDGVARFLVCGKLTDWMRHATHYPHPSNAYQAARSFVAKHFRGRERDVYTDLIDSRDVERTVP